MNRPDDEDDRLGLPAHPARPAPVPPPAPPEAAAPAAATATAEEGPALREGDTGLGVPEHRPRGVARLTADDWERLRREEEEAEEAELEALIAAQAPGLQLPGFLANPFVAAFLVAAAAAFGLFVYSHTISTLAGLSSLPLWAQYLGWAGLAILAGAVLYSAGRLAVLYVRLRASQQLPVKILQDIAERTHLRRLAQRRLTSAKALLEDYLRTYPLAEGREERALLALGFTEERLPELRAVRDELLDPNRFASTELWFERFGQAFQARLDEVAEQRVSYFARRVAIVTAVSSNSLVDTLVSTYCSFTMIGDVCRIYNLRSGWFGTAILLGRVFFNSYLAGKVNELEPLAEEQLQGLFAQSGPLYELVAGKVGGKLIGQVTTKVGVKTATGAFNYLLLRRLGRFTARLLRPVNPEQK